MSLYTKLNEINKADLVKLTQMLLELEEFSDESIRVISYIIESDLQVLKGVNIPDELKTRVIAKAIGAGTYAGYDYMYEELLDEDDDEYTQSDCGLAWVQYTDCLNFLNRLLQCIVTKPSIQFPI